MRLAILFLSVSCVAQPPIGHSAKYSFRSFLGQSLLAATDLDGITIYASNFAQVAPDTAVFPANVTGLVLVCNNLENVIIPVGATVDDRGGTCGIRRRVKAQNDGRDWEIDTQNKPVKVVSEKSEIAKGRSVAVADIPTNGEVAALRAGCRAAVQANHADRARRLAACDIATYDPDDMTPQKIAARRGQGQSLAGK